MKTIGKQEAYTRWFEVLQDVEAGERYVILHKGEPIAELVPPQTDNGQSRSKQAAEKLLRLMSTRSPVEADINSLINEGRN